MHVAIDDVRSLVEPGKKVVFVSGNFNIIHPGHLRLLNFAAECGDFLVVGVFDDSFPGVTLGEALRLEGVQAISAVGHAFILHEPAEAAIARLKPDVVVKGKEWEAADNPEAAIVEDYGGRLIFTSGETRFSLLELLQKELQEHGHVSSIAKPDDFPARHRFTLADLGEVIGRFGALRVVVIGDLIVDEYVNCEALGMSQEDPTIVVTPIRSDRFIGGAGIVAAHARGMGAKVSYVCVTGKDDVADYALTRLRENGVEVYSVADESRPTTLKQRYRAAGKTMLRVSHLREHEISKKHRDAMFRLISPQLKDADLVVFSDFNYGCLPQALVDRIGEHCTRNGTMLVADSQSSSQVGDVSRFKGMRLLTPTEREARLALRDFGSGLVVLAETLRNTARATDVFITLAAEGVLIQGDDGAGGFVTDRLPAFNNAPKDVSGAGDSMLIASALALASGADIWQSAYLGSLAAACQVARVGNTPLTTRELLLELQA